MARFIKTFQHAATQAGRILRLPARLRAHGGYFHSRPWAHRQSESICLLASHWIGDTLWASQVVEPLKERFPGKAIFAIARYEFKDMWHGVLPPEQVWDSTALISDRHRQTVSWKEIRIQAADMGSKIFDLVIDLMGNRYSAAFAFRMRPRGSLGFDGNELGWLYSHRVADAERAGEHLRCRPFRVIEPLIGESAAQAWLAKPVRPPAPTIDPAAAKAELELDEKPFAVLAPGAGWPAKHGLRSVLSRSAGAWPPEAGIAWSQAQMRTSLCAIQSVKELKRSFPAAHASRLVGPWGRWWLF